jgi:uncharacterized protein (DUF2237 family)
MNNFAPDKQGEDRTYACERTWFFVNDLITKGGLDLSDRETALPLIAGTIGQGVAREFLAHARIFTNELPTLKEILKDPLKTAVPTQPGHIYGMCGSIAAHAKDAIMDPLLTYLNRYPIEYQAMCMREIITRDSTLTTNSAVAKWLINNGSNFS